MQLRPKNNLSEKEVRKGLALVIWDGLTAEVMTALTGGTFLTAMALLLGASNFQIGWLASLPTLTNVFQIASIYFVRQYNNRRVLTVFCAICARLPLVVIGLMPLLFPRLASIQTLIFFLFFFYLFGSIGGLSWNSWMKDLVPENELGVYFSRRTSYTQTLNVVLSLITALLVDFVKSKYPHYELYTYGIMFLMAGFSGLSGAFILSRVPEPKSIMPKTDLVTLFRKPLRDANFRKMMLFNSAWVFAVNIASPFFTVFMLRTLGLPISYIIILTIISQLFGILTVRTWGVFADRYSNKTIIAISAPLYTLTLLGWCFAGIYTHRFLNIGLLVLIHIATGISNAGVNLSLTNIGLKLAPKEDAIVYLSARNMITALFSSTAPLLGGYLADYFSSRHLNITISWAGPNASRVFHLLELHEWNFLFLIGAVFAFIAVELLIQVRETGEVDKDEVLHIMRHSIRNNLKEFVLINYLVSWHEQLWAIIRRLIPIDFLKSSSNQHNSDQKKEHNDKDLPDGTN